MDRLGADQMRGLSRIVALRRRHEERLEADLLAGLERVRLCSQAAEGGNAAVHQARRDRDAFEREAFAPFTGENGRPDIPAAALTKMRTHFGARTALIARAVKHHDELRNAVDDAEAHVTAIRAELGRSRREHARWKEIYGEADREVRNHEAMADEQNDEDGNLDRFGASLVAG